MGYAEKSGRGWRARWKKPDGKLDGLSGFPTRSAAKRYANDQEAKIREGRWLDPARGEISLGKYFSEWLPAQDLAPRTVERYAGYYRNHLKAAFGARALKDIDPLLVDAFAKDLAARRAPNTVSGVMRMFGMLMADAAADRRIEFSPVRQKRRRGRRTAPDVRTRKGIAVELEAVQAIRARLPRTEALMVLVAAFTGMRWGEVAGMRRKYLVLIPDAPGGPSGYYEIDPKDGALHEAGGSLYYGPPKGAKGRTVHLPPFLVELLAAHLATLPAGQQLLFPDGALGPWRRSNFNRRLWRPACDGWEARPAVRGHAAREAAAPIVATLRFHDLRHTQETWLSEDKIEKIARDERLGHVTPGMEGTYNHPTPVMRAEILKVLQARWDRYWSTVQS
jgi:integrase